MTQFPALIYAAGKGTRMGALTQHQPKPMVSVAGRPLIDHALDLIDQVTVRKCVVNVHYMADQLRQHLGARSIVFSDETDLLRETGGGLKYAQPLLGGSPVMTLNSDAVWAGPNPLQRLIDTWDDKMGALLLMVPPANVHGHKGQGDFHIAPDGRLTRGAGHVYSGAQIIRTDLLDQIQDTVFSTNVLWDLIADQGGLYGVSYDGHWCDVGQPSSIPVAEKMLKDHVHV